MVRRNILGSNPGGGSNVRRTEWSRHSVRAQVSVSKRAGKRQVRFLSTSDMLPSPAELASGFLNPIVKVRLLPWALTGKVKQDGLLSPVANRLVPKGMLFDWAAFRPMRTP